MKFDELARLFLDSDDFSGTVRQNESLSKHTTMNVGGNAKLFLEPENEDSLIFAIKLLKSDLCPVKSLFILGGGSNVVISDKGLDFVLSTRKLNSIKTESTNFTNGNELEISAGAVWGSVISFCRKNNLSGFEAFTGLSGTVGGAIFMNASCFGLSASDNLISVRYLDLKDFQIHEYTKKESDWSYKKSPFQTILPFIILSAKFTVTSGFDAEFSEKCIASRKEKGHFLAPSSGSAFKNDSENGIVAGKVIDECGLKGFSVGGAQIASWHGNFIINPERKATASDIKKLSDEVKKIVFEKKGIRLENEILFIGEDF